MTDTSFEWYRRNAARYAEVACSYGQSEYHDSTHPGLRHDRDVIARTCELAPGRRGLDAGCGPGARDVADLVRRGYDMMGMDAVSEGLDIAVQRYPALRDRLVCHDLTNPWPLRTGDFDFVICNSVIQHIEPSKVYATVFPELIRVLKPGGVALLHFKTGRGTWTTHDPDYDLERSFLLYEDSEVASFFASRDSSLVPRVGDSLGGIVYGRDTKESPECLMWIRKDAEGSDRQDVDQPSLLG